MIHKAREFLLFTYIHTIVFCHKVPYNWTILYSFTTTFQFHCMSETYYFSVCKNAKAPRVFLQRVLLYVKIKHIYVTFNNVSPTYSTNQDFSQWPMGEANLYQKMRGLIRLFFEEMDVYLLATLKKRGLFFQLLIDGTHQTTIHLNHSICNALKDRNWQRGCRGCLKQYYPISHKIWEKWKKYIATLFTIFLEECSVVNFSYVFWAICIVCSKEATFYIFY